MLTSSKGEHSCLWRSYVRIQERIHSGFFLGIRPGAVMTTIKISDELAHELDQLAGSKPRSAYAAEVLWNDIRRNRQRKSLMESAGTWKTEDHPELAQGGAAYVEQIRSEPDARYETALKSRER